MGWDTYDLRGRFDELIGPGQVPRPAAQRLLDYLSTLGVQELGRRASRVEEAIRVMGITFRVYSDGQTLDRSWPLDVIPRVIAEAEWRKTAEGLAQRVRALNYFIQDIYNERRILKDRVVPESLILESPNYRAVCAGFTPPHGVWAHICGCDLVRDADGTLYVLEDNLRIPSGVSYMVENRLLTKRAIPELFSLESILPVDDYTSHLHDMLASLSPATEVEPTIAVLTPGVYNSAYYEHSWLARHLGAHLVEGPDLMVGSDDCVYMNTISGWQRVHVIYRRVDDAFIDPEVFDLDSVLGVRGLIRAWRKGKVALANAPGAGVADDKVVYAFVPDMIRYYLKEEPILPNVPTYLCFRDKEREHVLDNLHDLVVKPANESGGYGMLIGPASTEVERARFRDLIRANPRNYIAQPTLSLSTVPTLCMGTIEPRHVDLRPFVLSGEKLYVTTGGLTRVALRKDSLIVNSSQGGGSKDTWIVRDIADAATRGTR